MPDSGSLRSSGRWNNGAGAKKRKPNCNMAGYELLFLAISMKYCAHPKCPHVAAIRGRPNYIAADPIRSNPLRSEAVQVGLEPQPIIAWHMLPFKHVRRDTKQQEAQNTEQATPNNKQSKSNNKAGNSQQQRQPVAGATITKAVARPTE